MYRLLLVDDEREIVDWLYDLFLSLDDLELDVYKALSGYEALEILDRSKVDIVLSDIKMPGISGIQLLEKIRSRWPACRVIFLTCYNEFDYVYTAIKYDCVGYLLKTESDTVIVDHVRKAIMELERITQNKDMLEKVCRSMEQAIPMVQREVIMDFILNPDGGREATQAKLDDIKIPLMRNLPVYLAIGRFDRMMLDATPTFGVRMIVNLKLRAEELFGGNFIHVSLIQQSNIDLMWLLQPVEQHDAQIEDRDRTYIPLLGGALEALQDFSRQALEQTTSFAYVSKSVSWEEIETSYAALVRLITISEDMGGEAILNDRNFQDLLVSAPQDGDYSLDGKLMADLKMMSVLLERGERETYMMGMKRLLDFLRCCQGRKNAVAQEVYYTLATMLLSQLNRMRLVDKLPANLDIGRLTRADVHGGWNEASSYLTSVAQAYFDVTRSAQETNVCESIEMIQQYIREHLCEELSLLKLAEVSYFNPSYLSRLFKQKTGQNLTDYIADLRIDMAKKLLRDYGKKIGDIALTMGYESQHYFSRFFKKHTGMTPQDYRKNLQIT